MSEKLETPEEQLETSVQTRRIGVPIPRELQTFICCLILQLHLPIVPLLLEYVITGTVSNRSVVLTAAIFVLSTSLASRNIAFLALGIVTSIIFSCLYGVLMVGQTSPPFLSEAGWITIEATIVMHGIERFNRHFYEKEPFFNV